MAEYIEREAFLDALERMKPYHQEADDIAEMLQNFSAADVRPVVRARWKPVMCAGNPNIQDRDEWYGYLFVCEKCNRTMIGKSNYCPKCGAMMEES